MTSHRDHRHHRRSGLFLAIVATVAEAIALRRLGYAFGGNVVVRCRAGHRFTTIWIPGVSFKAIRLGWWRVQRCPAGRHWALVTPVRRADLTPDDLRAADETRDIRIP
jgi:hypothetical protein